jgi:hypothetical protein
MTSPASGGGRASRAALPPLNTRPPTCKTAWPRIALPGPGGSGKSWELAKFSGSDRVGRTLWLQLTESAADEYGGVPGARFELINHDGSYQSIIAELRAAKAHAQAAADAGEQPWVLGVDTVSAFWDMLKAWADWRARQSDASKAKLRRDPNADIKVSMNIWEDVARRWKEFMGLLLTGPWILVMLVKGKLVVAMTEDGRPDQDTPKQYKIEARQGFDHDAAQIVRMSTDEPPLIVKLRTVHGGIRPGIEKPESVPDFSLEWLVFDRLKFDPAKAAVPEVPELTGGGLTEDERTADDEQPSGNQQRPCIVSSLPTAEQQAASAEKARGLVAWTLEPGDVDLAARRATKLAEHTAKDQDILPFLDDDQRERLGVDPTVERIALARLGVLVVNYVDRHKCSPLAPLDEPEPVPGEAQVAAVEESETNRQARLLRELDEVEKRRAAVAAEDKDDGEPDDKHHGFDDIDKEDRGSGPFPETGSLAEALAKSKAARERVYTDSADLPDEDDPRGDEAADEAWGAAEAADEASGLGPSPLDLAHGDLPTGQVA